MEINPTLQGMLLLCSCLFGVIMGIVQDFFICGADVLKIPKKLRVIVRFFGDFLWMITAAIGLVLLCYYYNRGAFRIYCATGFFLAFLLYKTIFSCLSKKVIEMLLELIYKVVKIILYPLVKVCKIMSYMLKKTKYCIVKTIEKVSVLVYNIYVRKRTVRRARRGFLNIQKK